MRRRLFFGVLILFNSIVLLGQLWPEGAPPFARWVNVGFLVVTLGWFGTQALGRGPASGG